MAADDLVHDPSRNTSEDDDPLRRVRLEKLAALRDMEIEPYPVTFSRTAEAAELDKRHADLAAGAETEESVRVAGRIRAMRRKSSMSSALWCVMNGLAAAPPGIVCSIGVSTSR